LAGVWREFERDESIRSAVEREGAAKLKEAREASARSSARGDARVLANSGYYWEVVRGVNLAAERLRGRTSFALVNFPHVCNRSCNFCFTTFKAKSSAHKNEIPLAEAHETAARLFAKAAGEESELGKTVVESVNPLSLDDLKAFVDAFAAAGGLSLEVSGWGESTLFEEFPEFVRRAAKCGVPVTLITNAELDRDYWCEVVEAVLGGNGTIVVSLHHISREKHHKFLGGVFERAFGNLELAAEIAGKKGVLKKRENGIDVYRVATHTTVMPENIRDLAELQARVSELGVFVSFAPVGLVGLAESMKSDEKKLEEFLYCAQSAWLPNAFQNDEALPGDMVGRVAEIIKSFPHKGDNSIIHSLTSEILFSKFSEFAAARGLTIPKARQACATYSFGATLDSLTGAVLPDAHGFELLRLLPQYPRLHEVLREPAVECDRGERLRAALHDAWVEQSLPLFVNAGCFFCPVRSPFYADAVNGVCAQVFSSK
jgi:MoaA/NifB/PqqE/SkfB family radical SAM enzyme